MNNKTLKRVFLLTLISFSVLAVEKPIVHLIMPKTEAGYVKLKAFQALAELLPGAIEEINFIAHERLEHSDRTEAERSDSEYEREVRALLENKENQVLRVVPGQESSRDPAVGEDVIEMTSVGLPTKKGNTGMEFNLKQELRSDNQVNQRAILHLRRHLVLPAAVEPAVIITPATPEEAAKIKSTVEYLQQRSYLPTLRELAELGRRLLPTRREVAALALGAAIGIGTFQASGNCN